MILYSLFKKIAYQKNWITKEQLSQKINQLKKSA